MKDLVASLIAGTLVVPLVILFIKIYNEIEAKKARKERLYYCQRRLHKIALQFRDDCMESTKEVVAQYTDFLPLKSLCQRIGYSGCPFLSEYLELIDRLQEEYTVSYAIKYAEGDNWLRAEAEDLPNYILDEYRAEISEIAKTFRDFEYLMWMQIHESKEDK